MNKEIKEILYVLKQIVIGRASRLTCREADKLLNYITDLQEIEKDHQRINGELRQQLKQTEELAMEYKKENERLKELYRRTCNHLFDIGNDELARYFQAQISECNTFTTQGSDSNE